VSSSNDRRSGEDRRQHSDRRDHYQTIVQRLILGSGAIGAIYGQAEMLGEPWRHVVAVAAVVVLLVVAVWMKAT
jgi:hypothetical protein